MSKKVSEREQILEKIRKTRNIGIMAHIDAGKTTVSERFLYYSGKTYKIGEVDEGSTIMDWMDQERERGITITSAATTTTWKDVIFNFIDTPGHVDFTAEVERSLRVLDGAIAVFCAVGGVEPQSETVWFQADRYKIPRIAFINKMDRVGADFWGTIEQMEKKLTKGATPIQIPIVLEFNFKGVIDLVTMRALYWDDDSLGAIMTETEIPEEYKETALKWRETLLDRIVEKDDALLAKYLENQTLSVEEIRFLIRKATIDLEIFPVLCGAALRNKGIQPLFDAVAYYLPSPLDIPPITGVNPVTNQEEQRPCDLDAPLSALMFKIQNDPERRKIYYLRLYSGSIHDDSVLYNARSKIEVRITRLLQMHANKRERIESGYPGDIVATIGLRNTITGDTLSNIDHPIIFESMKFPEPVIFVAIEPKTIKESEKLAEALEKLTEEDPTFKVKIDKETGQTIISGMGELHLEILIERLLREFHVNARVGKPQVAYRESIKTTGQSEMRFIKQTAGTNHHAHVALRVEPCETGKGNQFVNEIPDERLPKHIILAIEDAVMSGMSSGIVLGYPIVDVKVALVDGSFNIQDSTEADFRYIAMQVFHDACLKAQPLLLEPIMSVELVIPKEFFGEVVGNLNQKGGSVEQFDSKAQYQLIKAHVALSQMFGYATDLRSLTQGRGTFTMTVSHYDVAKKKMAELF